MITFCACGCGSKIINPDDHGRYRKIKRGHGKPMLGRKMSKTTRFKMSQSHKGKELSYEHKLNLSKSLKGKYIGIKNAKWMGDKVSYTALHKWIYRHWGEAKKCEQCGSDIKVQWSNISGKYIRERSDWRQLCQSCHRKDDAINQKGIAKTVFERRTVNGIRWGYGKRLNI